MFSPFLTVPWCGFPTGSVFFYTAELTAPIGGIAGFQARGLNQPTVERIREGSAGSCNRLHCRREGGAARLHPVDAANGSTVALHPVRKIPKRFDSFDAHRAFDGLEPTTIAELSAESTEIDMGQFERKIWEVRAQHGKVERGTTERDE